VGVWGCGGVWVFGGGGGGGGVGGSVSLLTLPIEGEKRPSI
jgi:hypothetical protein